MGGNHKKKGGDKVGTESSTRPVELVDSSLDGSKENGKKPLNVPNLSNGMADEGEQPVPNENVNNSQRSFASLVTNKADTKVWRLWRENKGEQLIDRSLNPDFPITEALRWINIALLCVQEDPKTRPTMSTVVFMLEGQWSQNLPAPLEPRSSFTRHATVLELTMTTSDTTTNPSIDLTSSVIDPLPKKKKFCY
ncbi:cysteine-rich receptor-like protein kinase 20 [Tanacetum coccineum]